MNFVLFSLFFQSTHTHTHGCTLEEEKQTTAKKMYKKNTHTNIQTNKSKKKLKENHWET